MRNTNLKKLAIRRETVRVLHDAQLSGVGGAAFKTTYLGTGINACSFTSDFHNQQLPSCDCDAAK